MAENRTILLIEDSDTQAMRFAMLLESTGASVHRVATAEEGLRHLETSRPDLVIVDRHLPGLQGDAFCRTVRGDPTTGAIPLMLLTADSASDAERHSTDCGADDYVSKGGDHEALLGRVEALLRKPA